MERKRRSFTPEYKAEVVGLIRDGGKAASTVARGLGLTESAVRRWVVQSETDAGRGDGKILTTAERKELSQLRREIRQLRMEREILKKSHGLLRQEIDVRHRFIAAEKAEYPVTLMSRILQVGNAVTSVRSSFVDETPPR